MNLENDIAKFAIKSGKDVEKVRRGVVLKLFSSVINDTPVDHGRLRGNWQTTASQPAKGVLSNLDPSGAAALSRLFSTDFTDQDAYLTNNLPYARLAEYGGWSGPTDLVTSKGYSRKSPSGMVRKNVIRFKKLLAAEARKASNS